MISILTSKKYDKSFAKKDRFVQEKAIERIKIFQQDPFNYLLDNHKLHGELGDERSFNVTGDFRITFYHINDNTVIFTDIGTHTELYG